MEEVVVLDGSFKKSLSAREFFPMLEDACPFCGSPLRPLNRKRTIIGCHEQDCDPKFVSIKNLKIMFYFDWKNDLLNLETFDISVDFSRGITTVKKYFKNENVFSLKGTLNIFDKEDMEHLKLFVRRVSQVTIFE